MNQRKIKLSRLGTQLAANHPSNVFVQIVRSVRPGVVSITTEQPTTTRMRPRGFSDFLDSPTHQQVEQQFGTGFIIHQNGYILTNFHVVQHAEKILVKVEGIKTPFVAKIVWKDEQRDVSVIQIQCSRTLKALRLGDSSRTEVGEWVLAVGNPFGLEQSATLGIISGKNRPLQLSNRSYRGVIQTDAAINPGNSGGPLINMLGQVIGINTLIIYPSQCLGFAIPIEDIRPLIQKYL